MKKSSELKLDSFGKKMSKIGAALTVMLTIPIIGFFFGPVGWIIGVVCFLAGLGMLIEAMNTKYCPHCRGELEKLATTCKYCGNSVVID